MATNEKSGHFSLNGAQIRCERVYSVTRNVQNLESSSVVFLGLLDHDLHTEAVGRKSWHVIKLLIEHL